MQGRALKISLAILTLSLVAAAQTIPAGTRLTVRIDSQVNSATAQTGDRFSANLTRDLVVDGATLAKAGAPVKGKVTYVKPSGRLHAPGELTLRLASVEVGGKMVPISTSGFHASDQDRRGCRCRRYPRRRLRRWQRSSHRSCGRWSCRNWSSRSDRQGRSGRSR